METKVVFVTGGSGGIGRATALKFAREGWNVAVFYKGEEAKAFEVKSLIEKEGQRGEVYQTDVADQISVSEAFLRAFRDFGRVDGLANVAGISLGLALSDQTTETVEQEIGVNFKGVVWCTKEIVKYMKEGAIVNITSVSTYGMGPTRDSVYSGTKGAVWAFTKQMAIELAPGIRVNAVAPGLVETELARRTHTQEDREKIISETPLKKNAQPEDIANSIYFLVSDQASHITGATLDVNGGYYIR